jgi:hypothetical protein
MTTSNTEFFLAEQKIARIWRISADNISRDKIKSVTLLLEGKPVKILENLGEDNTFKFFDYLVPNYQILTGNFSLGIALETLVIYPREILVDMYTVNSRDKIREYLYREYTV